MKSGKTVDDYISKSIWRKELERLRAIVDTTELDETIKWGAPCYTVHDKNVVGFAAFKSYFGLWFHQGALLSDEAKVLINAQEGKTKALRQWRMTSQADIDEKLIKRYLKEAISLAKDGTTIAPDRNKPLTIPGELTQMLRNDKTANMAFAALRPGRQREFANYIADAKRDETKVRRLKKILPLIKAGVGLNDQYKK